MTHLPIWGLQEPAVSFAPIKANLEVDVAIIGAGITGLTLAHRLKEAGRTVAVLEMHAVGSGATSHTTGHLTAAMDLGYSVLQASFGQAGAAEAATKSMAAIDYIAGLVARYGIDCDFQRVSGWRYTEDPEGGGELEAEYAVARALGLSVELVGRGPLPFMHQALRFGDQAIIDPSRYLQALARMVHGDRCHIFEHSRVDDVVVGDPCQVRTGSYTVTAVDVVHATHVPIGLVLPLQLRIAPYMSYVIAVRLGGQLPPDMYWDTAEPYHYIRPARAADGTRVLLIGGEDHKTGQEPDTTARFTALEQYARQRFSVSEIVGRWAGEVFEPVDGFPYIGRLGPHRHVYCATGFGGTGLTLGTVAAADICGLILDEARPLSFFAPQRYKPVASARNFLRQTGNVAWRIISDRLHGADAYSVGEIPPGEGRLTEVEGKKLAVYREPGGDLHLLSPVCPHLGGIVQWNSALESWDCPLHGSRFSPTGEVLAGPACQELCRIQGEAPASEASPEPGPQGVGV